MTVSYLVVVSGIHGDAKEGTYAGIMIDDVYSSKDELIEIFAQHKNVIHITFGSIEKLDDRTLRKLGLLAKNKGLI